MTPRARIYAEDFAEQHGVSVDAIFSKARKGAVTAARWALWQRMASEGLTPVQIESETGHHRASVHHALRRMRGGAFVRQRAQRRPRKAAYRPLSEEGLRIVQANIAAMQAKHQRDLAQRY